METQTYTSTETFRAVCDVCFAYQREVRDLETRLEELMCIEPEVMPGFLIRAADDLTESHELYRMHRLKVHNCPTPGWPL